MFKAELVRNRGPWKSIDDLEIAVAEYIDWFNHRRFHGEIGLVPPAEYEDTHYRHNPATTTVGASVQSLHRTRHGTPREPHGSTPSGSRGDPLPVLPARDVRGLRVLRHGVRRPG